MSTMKLTPNNETLSWLGAQGSREVVGCPHTGVQSCRFELTVTNQRSTGVSQLIRTRPIREFRLRSLPEGGQRTNSNPSSAVFSLIPINHLFYSICYEMNIKKSPPISGPCINHLIRMASAHPTNQKSVSHANSSY